MQSLTAKELRQAKAHAALRFHAIGLAILKEAGVKTWTFHDKGLRGRAWPKKRHLVCPKPTTRRRLYILAHECAHIALNHIRSKPSHRQEFEAEMYAHEALRRHDVAVPKKETERAKRYVAYRIDQAIRMGKATKLDRESVEWTTPQHRPATQHALKAGTIELIDLGSKSHKRIPRPTRAKRPKPVLTLAQHIRQAAKASRLSVNQIAHQAGIDQSALNRFLNGTRENIRLDVAERLFRLLGLAVAPETASSEDPPSADIVHDKGCYHAQRFGKGGRTSDAGLKQARRPFDEQRHHQG